MTSHSSVSSPMSPRPIKVMKYRNRLLVVVVAVFIGAFAAAAPKLVRRKSNRETTTTLGTAVGMPGAPPTSAKGLQERIDDMERRLGEKPDDAGAAVLLADALLRQARATNDSRPANRASQVLKAILTEDPVQYDALRMLG